MYDNFNSGKLPEYTPEEWAFADAIVKTTTDPKGTELRIYLANDPQGLAASLKNLGDKSLCDFLLPYTKDLPSPSMAASSDVGDVSWNVPTAQVVTTCYAAGTPAHSWQLVSQDKTPLGYKGMLTAAKVIAASCIDVFEHPEIAEKAKAELKEQLGGSGYHSAIPGTVKPQAISKL
jgi:aminobenzoyl-glutamate utilization protein B